LQPSAVSYRLRGLSAFPADGSEIDKFGPKFDHETLKKRLSYGSSIVITDLVRAYAVDRTSDIFSRLLAAVRFGDDHGLINDPKTGQALYGIVTPMMEWDIDGRCGLVDREEQTSDEESNNN
jgi:hypothetical protein